jgi:hypothetical protein
LTAPANAKTTFAPRFPTLVATGVCSLWIFILSLPMWAGKFLGTVVSDQYTAGYGYRHWAAEQVRATGKFPLWNPEIFGGLPFAGALHGDQFYPTAGLRLLLPTDVAMNLGFAVHYVLAGLFAYLFFRKVGMGWAGGILGGLAYQLTGVVASYVNPGHDGKLFVTALFPLALLGLWMGMRERRYEGFALLALAVGLGFLSPQLQMLYYMLVACGIFALYLAFGEPSGEAVQPRIVLLAAALGAVILGAAIGAIQFSPFFAYLPYSPRAEGIGSWARATSYAIPWDHVPEFFFQRFVGEITTSGRTYWGSNSLKLHSEYLGLPVVALAVFGIAGSGYRRLKWWLGGIAILFLLVALGGDTPFYRLWYLMPFMGSVRAPGMALYIPAFVLALFAGFGLERLQRREGRRHAIAWLAIGGSVVLLALAGVFGSVASALATGIQLDNPNNPAVQMAGAAGDTIRRGAAVSGAALLVLGGLAFAVIDKKTRLTATILVIVGVVSADLWWNARTFWNYSDAADTLFAGDAVTEELQARPLPYRVLPFGVYQGAILMAYDIPELLGHHANELDAFDKLVGRVGQGLAFTRHVDPKIWELYAVNTVIVNRQSAPDSLPGFTKTQDDVPTADGASVVVFERNEPVPYARLVAGALKLPQDQVVPTVLDSRFPVNRLVALDSTAHFDPPALTAVPDSVAASVSVTGWAPGEMRLQVTPAAPEDAFVVISENWYFQWQATVDGEPVRPVRGNGALLTIPVAAGAREIDLTYGRDAYRRGKGITLAAFFLVLVGLVAPVGIRRRRKRG